MIRAFPSSFRRIFSPVLLFIRPTALPLLACGEKWSGRADLNRRPLDPQSSALSKLRHAPNDFLLPSLIIPAPSPPVNRLAALDSPTPGRQNQGSATEHPRMEAKMANRDAHRSRRTRLIRLFRKGRVDGLLVNALPNVYYLSGFRGDDSMLLVTPAKTFLMTDSRYAEQAAQETRGIEIVVRKKGILKALSRPVRTMGVGRLGVEARAMTLAQADALREQLPKAELVHTSGLVERLRVVKDRAEVAAIRRAVAIAEEAFRLTVQKLRPKMTEREVALLLERTMEDLGADGPAFPSIVAAGERSSLPHARPTNRRIRRGEAVLFDWGARLDLYHSDLTRMVFLDRIPAFYRRLYDVVLGAQRRAIARLRAGLRTGGIDASARAYLKAHRHNKHFGHGLGHGVGLEIHEAPNLRAKGDERLRPGMVFTVEPGAYLPGRGGVRVEDMVLITRKGHAMLTSLPKSLDASLIKL